MLNLTPVTKTFQFGGQEVTLETQRIARQASGAVLVTMGGVQVLATVVGKKDMKPGQDFFPLTVNYQEKYYAAGKIPGGFLKRESRPSEKETLRIFSKTINLIFMFQHFLNRQLKTRVNYFTTCHCYYIIATILASINL